MSQQSFQPGDVVYLKSGSCPMTVKNWDGDAYDCVYYIPTTATTEDYTPFGSEEFIEAVLTQTKPFFL